MIHKLLLALAVVTALSFLAVPAFAAGAPKVPGAIWADGILFDTVLTPTTLPNQGNFDRLYNFDGSGLDGQASISEAKPGDSDYNGGRWEVYGVVFTPQGKQAFDPDGDGKVNFQITSDSSLWQHLAAGNVTVGSDVLARFVCPLNPRQQ